MVERGAYVQQQEEGGGIGKVHVQRVVEMRVRNLGGMWRIGEEGNVRPLEQPEILGGETARRR